MQEALRAARDAEVEREYQTAQTLKEKGVVLGEAWYLAKLEGSSVNLVIVNTVPFLRQTGRSFRTLLLGADRPGRTSGIEGLADGIHVKDPELSEFAGVRKIRESLRTFIDPTIEYALGIEYQATGAAVLTASFVSLGMLEVKGDMLPPPSSEAHVFAEVLNQRGSTEARVAQVINAYLSVLEKVVV